MEKQKILLYPNHYKQSTQVVFFKEIANAFNLIPVHYEEYYHGLKSSFLTKLKVFIYTISLCLKSVFYFGRKSVFVKKVNLSHPTIETYLKENKAYVFKKNKIFFLLLYKAIKIRIIVDSLPNVKFLIGGDEAYLFGSIYGQIAANQQIANIFFKDFGVLCGFTFLNKSLYAGLNNYKNNTVDISNLDIKAAENYLLSITEGETEIFYMKPRMVNEILIHDFFNREKKYIILYLHDFIDSPGVYGGSVFNDIPSWVKFCCKQTSKTGYTLVIKTHPNASQYNIPLVDQLEKEVLRNFKHVEFCRTDFRLSKLSKHYNIHCILTVFGSIINEAAFLGIPSISCSVAPADFFIQVSKNATNKKQLVNLISKIKHVDLETKISLRQKSIISIAYIDYYISLSKLNNLPYDSLSMEIKKQIFNSEFDIDLYHMTNDYWKDSRRLENFVLRSLKADTSWKKFIINISGFSN